jgi:uncharacterized protein YrrD
MLRLGSSLKGYKIEATDGSIGSVADLLFDDTTWKLRWMVVDTGGWLGGAKVLIHPSMIGVADDVDETLSVRLSKKQVENSPGRLQDRPMSQQSESDLYDYYGWDPAWSGSYFGPGAIMSSRLSGNAKRRADMASQQTDGGDPHLRSINAVTGYHVHATDGAIGHVEDMLIDDQNWLISYLIIDTSNWWIGQHVLISPFAVQEINYSDSIVRLNIPCDRIRSSPPWASVDPVDAPYQIKLHGYYDWPGYGW